MFHVFLCVYVFAYPSACALGCVSVSVSECMYASVSVCVVFVRVHACVSAHVVWFSCVCMRVCLRTCVRMYVRPVCVCFYVCTCLSIRRVPECISVCVFECVSACCMLSTFFVRVCTCVCVCV